MRIIRTSSFFPDSDGEVWCDWCGCDSLDGLTMVVRVKVLDEESDMYGWNWIFIVLNNDNVKVRVNGNYLTVVNEFAELVYDDVSYYLSNSCVSCVIVWRGELTDEEMDIVEDDGIVRVDDILLYLSFYDEKVVSVNAGNVSVVGGRYMLGDSVDGKYLCYMAKVMDNG